MDRRNGRQREILHMHAGSGSHLSMADKREGSVADRS